MAEFEKLPKKEQLKWLCSAILATLARVTNLTPASERLVEEIRTHKRTQKLFMKVLEEVTTPNSFGITEIAPEDYHLLREYVLPSKYPKTE